MCELTNYTKIALERSKLVVTMTYIGYQQVFYMAPLSSLQFLLVSLFTTKTLVICNHSICDYMQLSIICNFVLSFFTTSPHPLRSTNFFYYGASTKLHIFSYWLTFWNFHSEMGFYVYLVTKLFATWLLIMVYLYIYCTLGFLRPHSNYIIKFY
jgi:hypothetical protein